MTGGPSAGPRVVQLMVTCLCDAFFDDVARATVEVLEHLGCAVAFPRDQTCCGQPAYNAGDWDAARRVARHTLRVFAGGDRGVAGDDPAPVVTPSGSCARMLSHGAPLLFEGHEELGAAHELARRAFELAEFVVRVLGVSRWPGRYAGTLAFHRSCHSRGAAYGDSALALLRSIDGARVVEVDEAEQCCGFGGTFAVRFPGISREIGALKLANLRAAAPDAVVSGDMGCLMHLDGLARREGRPIRVLHVGQVLRDALAAKRSAP